MDILIYIANDLLIRMIVNLHTINFSDFTII
jgi:hypothetical protein